MMDFIPPSPKSPPPKHGWGLLAFLATGRTCVTLAASRCRKIGELVALKDSLDDHLARKKQPKRCPLGHLRDQLDIDTRESLDIYILAVEADRDIPNHRKVFTIAGLCEIIKDNGYTMGKTTVSDHLRKACVCE